MILQQITSPSWKKNPWLWLRTRKNTATRKQRPAEKRIRVEERPTKKLREKFEGIGRWKDRDRRAGGIEEKKRRQVGGVEDVPRWFHIQESRASRRSAGSWPNALSVLTELLEDHLWIILLDGVQTFFIVCSTNQCTLYIVEGYNFIIWKSNRCKNQQLYICSNKMIRLI